MSSDNETTHETNGRRAAAELLYALGVTDFGAIDDGLRVKLADECHMQTSAGANMFDPDASSEARWARMMGSSSHERLHFAFAIRKGLDAYGPHPQPARALFDIGKALGFVPPEMPEWVQPGRYVHAKKHTSCNTRIDAIAIGPFVRLAGREDDPIPIGNLIRFYHPANAERCPANLPCPGCGVPMAPTGCEACSEKAHVATVERLDKQMRDSNVGATRAAVSGDVATFGGFAFAVDTIEVLGGHMGTECRSPYRVTLKAARPAASTWTSLRMLFERGETFEFAASDVGPIQARAISWMEHGNNVEIVFDEEIVEHKLVEISIGGTNGPAYNIKSADLDVITKSLDEMRSQIADSGAGPTVEVTSGTPTMHDAYTYYMQHYCRMLGADVQVPQCTSSPEMIAALALSTYDAKQGGGPMGYSTFVDYVKHRCPTTEEQTR